MWEPMWTYMESIDIYVKMYFHTYGISVFDTLDNDYNTASLITSFSMTMYVHVFALQPAQAH